VQNKILKQKTVGYRSYTSPYRKKKSYFWPTCPETYSSNLGVPIHKTESNSHLWMVFKTTSNVTSSNKNCWTFRIVLTIKKKTKRLNFYIVTAFAEFLTTGSRIVIIGLFNIESSILSNISCLTCSSRSNTKQRHVWQYFLWSWSNSLTLAKL